MALVLVTMLLAVPTAAGAATRTGATITSCRSDSLTVAGKVALSGSSARRARGTALQMRFQALPLFGMPRSGAWKGVGKKANASSQEAFAGLPADSWVGVMSWRFKRGSRTVLSGLAKTEPLRVGRAKGRAGCTIAEGVKPVDRTPPSLGVLPGDGLWHHAPVTVQLTAADDFSGVKSVSYGVDGGAKQRVPNGSTFQLAAEGAHTIDWEATDAAGNTATGSAAVRVDAGPPSKPAFSAPPAVTSSPTPTFQWSPSSDSGSGLGGYVLIIKRGDGSIAAFQQVGPDKTSVTSGATLNDGETYTAVVTAFDKTADTPWTSDSDPLTFRVDSQPDVSSPQDGRVLAFGAKSEPVVVNFDRAIDTRTKDGVSLTRDSGSSSPWSAPTCTTPCSSISFTPTSSFPEGRYTLTVDVKSEEGVPMQRTFHFAVPDPNNEDASLASTSAMCTPVPPPPAPYSVTTRSANETVRASFSYSLSGGTGRVRLIRAGDPSPPSVTVSPGTGSRMLDLALGAPNTYPLGLEYCIESPGGTLTLSDVWVSRLP
jgi:hypothetical protein